MAELRTGPEASAIGRVMHRPAQLLKASAVGRVMHRPSQPPALAGSRSCQAHPRSGRCTTRPTATFWFAGWRTCQVHPGSLGCMTRPIATFSLPSGLQAEEAKNYG
jgi:hypothetical protein